MNLKRTILLSIIMVLCMSAFALAETEEKGTVTFRPSGNGMDIIVSNYPPNTDVLYIKRADGDHIFAGIKLSNGNGNKHVGNLIPGMTYTFKYEDSKKYWVDNTVTVTLPQNSGIKVYASTNELNKKLFSDLLAQRKGTYFLKLRNQVNLEKTIDNYLYDNTGKKIGSYYHENLSLRPYITLEGVSNGYFYYRIETDPIVRRGGVNAYHVNKSVIEARKAVKKLKLKGKSQKKKCYIIADYLAKRCKYASGDNGLNYSAYGALVKKRAACIGYAEAYMLMCNEAGVDTVLVSGYYGNGGHTWVLQNIKGKTYSSDPTFADKGRYAYKKCLLRGTKDKSFHKRRKFFSSWNDGLYGFKINFSKKNYAKR